MTVAGTYFVDYQLFEPSPSAAATEGVSDVRYDRSSIDHARALLGLSEPDEDVESFTVVPSDPGDYLSVPAADIRLFFCAGQSEGTFCDPHGGKARGFHLDHVIHYDRREGSDSWDFVFVPDAARVGPLRFVYRSNTGGLGGEPDSFGFVLGEQSEEAGLNIENPVAGVLAFGDSSFAEDLDHVADDGGEAWWGEAHGGFEEIDSALIERAKITIPGEAWDVWSTILKVARWFAVLALVVGFLASLVSLADAGAQLLRQIIQIPKGAATALGVALGICAALVYFLIVGTEVKQEAINRADSGLRRIFTGSLAEVGQRAGRAGIEIEGLASLGRSIPKQAVLRPLREAPPVIRKGAGDGEVIVSGPLLVIARLGERAAWRFELHISTTVHVYKGPTADVKIVDIDNARIFPVGA